MLALLAPGAANAKWAIEGKEFTEGQSETVEFAATETATLVSKVLGSELQVTTSTTACDATCTVDQKGPVNHGAGRMVLSNLKVVKPAGCSITSPIITQNLTWEMIMDPGGGTATFIKYFPESGTTIAELTITGCAAAGTYPLTGSFACRVNNTGVSAVKQPNTCNPTEQATGGGSLKLGKEPASWYSRFVAWLKGFFIGWGWSGE
jgi:hypothetical protein